MWNEARSNTTAKDTSGASGGTARGPWQESPLVGAADVLRAQHGNAQKKFRFTERPFLDLVNLRGDADDAAFASAVQSVTGCRLPTKPNTVAQGEGAEVLWLGPDEWLVRSREPQAAVLEKRLAAALQGQFASAVDVGSGYTVIEVAGDKVRDVIARGCPLDLHPRLFAPGQCAQSHYFKASIVLVPTAADTFEVIVRRSFADYFCRIMLDAAAPLLL
ncbi:sarcosine oxidase subunit gamma [Paraburkholderia kururiensis]|uniref:Sarcosine oxidase subunit gamma n=1 Tax=Paraburkholderia kururiensis TaxID=984307 RepID=A0ABZ0WKA7_9BURK|nr:sarcosine oxidase subunit gamma [Paraburkholderia kururiensis]WQD77790.1 sarcosine oxidase subunit gamma [Paraburkholderia kururiensis]